MRARLLRFLRDYAPLRHWCLLIRLRFCRALSSLPRYICRCAQQLSPRRFDAPRRRRDAALMPDSWLMPFFYAAAAQRFFPAPFCAIMLPPSMLHFMLFSVSMLMSNFLLLIRLTPQMLMPVYATRRHDAAAFMPRRAAMLQFWCWFHDVYYFLADIFFARCRAFAAAFRDVSPMILILFWCCAARYFACYFFADTLTPAPLPARCCQLLPGDAFAADCRSSEDWYGHWYAFAFIFDAIFADFDCCFATPDWFCFFFALILRASALMPRAHLFSAIFIAFLRLCCYWCRCFLRFSMPAIIYIFFFIIDIFLSPRHFFISSAWLLRRVFDAAFSWCCLHDAEYHGLPRQLSIYRFRWLIFMPIAAFLRLFCWCCCFLFLMMRAAPCHTLLLHWLIIGYAAAFFRWYQPLSTFISMPYAFLIFHAFLITFDAMFLRFRWFSLLFLLLRFFISSCFHVWCWLMLLLHTSFSFRFSLSCWYWCRFLSFSMPLFLLLDYCFRRHFFFCYATFIFSITLMPIHSTRFSALLITMPREEGYYARYAMLSA